jgi:PAS domain S-box-containing protein
MESNENYNRVLFENTVIGLALCRMNGDLVDVNTAYAELLGRTVEQVLRLSYWQITPEKYIPQEKLQLDSLQSTGRYGPYEKDYIHAQGHLVPVRLSGQKVNIDGNEYIWSSVEDITNLKTAELERENLIEKLEKSLLEIKTLKGLIPICSYCKVIRNEEGNWEMLESYISNHSDAQFSHGTCPDCLEKELAKIKCMNSK